MKEGLVHVCVCYFITATHIHHPKCPHTHTHTTFHPKHHFVLIQEMITHPVKIQYCTMWL